MLPETKIHIPFFILHPFFMCNGTGSTRGHKNRAVFLETLSWMNKFEIDFKLELELKCCKTKAG